MITLSLPTVARKLLCGLALAASLLGAVLAQEKPGKRPLSEADVQKMVELQLDDDLIIGEGRKRTWQFTVNDAFLKRMKQAGASDSVLKYFREAGQPAQAVEENLMVWVTRESDSYDASLHSELYINEKLVDTFTSDTQKPVRQFLRPGANTILFKTKPDPRATRKNSLNFKIGPVANDKENQPRMQPLWLFDNGSDWRYENEKHVHSLGPNVKEVSVTVPLFYAGAAHLAAEVSEGAFVLESDPDSDYHDTSVTATVYVNGTPLTTFANQGQSVVITPWLKAGRNELKVVSRRVENICRDNDLALSITGFAQYNRQAQKYEMVPILQTYGHEGWERDQRTLKLVSRVDRTANAVERVLPFYLETDPNAGVTNPDPSDEPVVMLWSRKDSDYSDASLHSEIRINGEMVDVFSSNTRKAIGKLLKPGANRISVKTTAQPTAGKKNDLSFSIGVATRNRKDEVKLAPFWSFTNGTDWTYDDGVQKHALGLDVKEIAVEFPVYFAGVESLKPTVAAGDYVLQAHPGSDYYTTPVVANVVINGTPLNTLTQEKQQVVITSLLKKGKNEVKFTSERVGNIARDNDITVTIGGPAEFDLASQTYRVKPLVEWHALEGWQRNAKTLQLEAKADRQSARVEHTATFVME